MEAWARRHSARGVRQAGGPRSRTVRDEYADGLYADAGAEHFTEPDTSFYWGYIKESICRICRITGGIT